MRGGRRGNRIPENQLAPDVSPRSARAVGCITLIYNPLACFGKQKGFSLALFSIAVFTWIVWWGGLHLNGVFLFYISKRPAPALVSIFAPLVSWLVLGFILFVVARLFGGNGGLRVHLAAAGLSRFYSAVGALVMSHKLLGGTLLETALLKDMHGVLQRDEHITMFLAVVVFVVALLVVWAMFVLFFGYRTAASRIRGFKLLLSFVIGIVIAEAITRGLAFAFSHLFM